MNKNENEMVTRDASFEQAVKNMASMIHTYYEELKSEGFTEEQAMPLVEEFHTALIDRSLVEGADEK